MFGLGGGEILLVIFLAVIFLGPKKIPEVAKMLGRAYREFQKAKESFFSEVQNIEDSKAAHHDEDYTYDAAELRVEESKNSEIYNLENKNIKIDQKQDDQQVTLGG